MRSAPFIAIFSVAMASLQIFTAAHPHSLERSLEQVKALEHASRSLRTCNDRLAKRGHADRGAERRMAMAEKIREERGFGKNKRYSKRDTATVLNTSHADANLQDQLGLTQYVSPSRLFGSNSSCPLEADPDVTEGPYFVAGEYVRSDVSEDQEGVPVWLDIEVIDIETCAPVPKKYIEIWCANATGVYSGVVANGNGNSAAADNINSTFLRGLQETDDNGVVQFRTIVPGHYTGRTQHIHVAALSNATVEWNGTVYDTTAMHVGQMFFDQNLLTEVNTLEPYVQTESSDLTENASDSIFSQASAIDDPVLEYVYIGDDLNDGLLMWIQIGINTSETISMNAASTRYAAGGAANGDTMGMGGGGGAAPGGTPPSGNGAGDGGNNATMPTGAAPGGTSGMLEGSATGTAGFALSTGATTTS